MKTICPNVMRVPARCSVGGGIESTEHELTERGAPSQQRLERQHVTIEQNLSRNMPRQVKTWTDTQQPPKTRERARIRSGSARAASEACAFALVVPPSAGYELAEPFCIAERWRRPTWDEDMKERGSEKELILFIYYWIMAVEWEAGLFLFP